MEQTKLEKTLKKDESIYKSLRVALKICIGVAIFSVLAMLIIYIVINNQVSTIALNDKLSTKEQSELLSTKLSVPMKIFISILIISLVGIIITKITSFKQLKKKYISEYEMNDSMEN